MLIFSRITTSRLSRSSGPTRLSNSNTSSEWTYGSLYLALVASWQYRLAGSFYIFRSLQHYTIFLSTTTPAHAYGVLGLVSTIEETVPLPLPVLTQAVLLPFEHHIIYDSLFTSYNVMFGSGYRQDLQELYRNIQEREGIITSLLPEDQAAREANQRTDILVRNRKVFTAFRRELRKAGLNPQTVEGMSPRSPTSHPQRL